MKYLIYASMCIVLSGCNQKIYYRMMQDYQQNKNTHEAIKQGAPVSPESYDREMKSYEEYESSIQNSKF